MADKKQAKRVRDAVLTTCGITQELKHQFFNGWTDDELSLLDKGAMGIANVLMEKLYKAGFVVQEMHVIVHDRDTREVWDDNIKRYVIEQKTPHFHAAVKFLKGADGKVLSGTLVQIAAAVGVEAEYVEKAGKGRFAWDNMLSYLIHIKYQNKAQYEPNEVYSWGAEKNGIPTWRPYTEIYRERKKAWEEGRSVVTAKQAKVDVDILEEKVLLGELKKGQILLTDELYNIYARNKRRIDDAFETYADRKIAKTIQAMENGEFKLSVFFVTGKSHSGKSVFTEYLVKRIQRDVMEKFGEDWSVCTCAASNPFDEYLGEEILVMDDLRGIALTASDWLKLLDPDRVNIGSARYHNRRMACRVVIINSERDVLDFFYYVKGRGDVCEAMDQFYRRIIARALVYRVPDNLDVRRLEVGEMQETLPYKENEPGKEDLMVLHHDFNKDFQDMSYGEALARLSGLVIRRNGLSDGKTELVYGMPEDERHIDWDELMKHIKEDEEFRRLEDETRLEELEKQALEAHEECITEEYLNT